MNHRARIIPVDEELRPTEAFPGYCPFCSRFGLQTRGWCFECGQVVWCPACGAFGHDNSCKPGCVNECVWREPKMHERKR